MSRKSALVKTPTTSKRKGGCGMVPTRVAEASRIVKSDAGEGNRLWMSS